MKFAWRQIVVACIVGGGVGFAGAWIAAPHLRHHGWDGGRFQHRLLDRFSKRLKLTPEQRSQVASILELKRQKIEALRSEFQPRFEEIRASTKAEIRRLLTPEQQQRFDAMQAEWEARAKKWHHEESMKDWMSGRSSKY